MFHTCCTSHCVPFYYSIMKKESKHIYATEEPPKSMLSNTIQITFQVAPIILGTKNVFPTDKLI